VEAKTAHDVQKNAMTMEIYLYIGMFAFVNLSYRHLESPRKFDWVQFCSTIFVKYYQ